MPEPLGWSASNCGQRPGCPVRPRAVSEFLLGLPASSRCRGRRCRGSRSKICQHVQTAGAVPAKTAASSSCPASRISFPRFRSRGTVSSPSAAAVRPCRKRVLQVGRRPAGAWPGIRDEVWIVLDQACTSGFERLPARRAARRFPAGLRSDPDTRFGRSEAGPQPARGGNCPIRESPSPHQRARSTTIASVESSADCFAVPPGQKLSKIPWLARAFPNSRVQTAKVRCPRSRPRSRVLEGVAHPGGLTGIAHSGRW